MNFDDEQNVGYGREEVGNGEVDVFDAFEPEDESRELDEPSLEEMMVASGELDETGLDDDTGVSRIVPETEFEEADGLQVEDERPEDEQVSEVVLGVDEEDALQLKQKAEELKEQMGKPDVVNAVNFAMVDNEGNIIDTRKRGNIELKLLNIETDIVQTRRARSTPQDLFSLQEQLRKFGQIEPIHVVIFGERYLLLSGYRRLQACINIGKKEILAIVDGTIPAEMVKYFEPMVNGVAPYTFREKLDYGKFFKETQKDVGYDVIEGILGLRTGDFLKGLYIDTMKAEFMDTYQQVEKGKLSIEQAFKKIEKELEKREKEETSGIDQLNSGELDDKLRNTNELTDMTNEAGKQELGNRKYLDPVLRRSIESRDGGYCQCCGYGEGEPDFMGVFNVHHIIAVQYGGSDSKSNLVLLCSNCHTLVHDYESGRFMPEESTYNRRSDVKKIVILGNMLQITRARALEELRRRHEAIGRQVDAGKITIGQGIKKAEIDVKGEEYFNNSPYQTFMDNVDNLKFGGKIDSELSEVSWTEEVLDENEFEGSGTDEITMQDNPQD